MGQVWQVALDASTHRRAQTPCHPVSHGRPTPHKPTRTRARTHPTHAQTPLNLPHRHRHNRRTRTRWMHFLAMPLFTLTSVLCYNIVKCDTKRPRSPSLSCALPLPSPYPVLCPVLSHSTADPARGSIPHLCLASRASRRAHAFPKAVWRAHIGRNKCTSRSAAPRGALGLRVSRGGAWRVRLEG